MTHDAPRPADYGLKEDVVKYFSSKVKPSEYLPGLLGWVGLISLSFLLSPFTYISKHQLAWPILILYLLPGMLTGWTINKLRVTRFEHSKKRHPQYSKWQEYQAVYSQWYKLYLKEQNDQRAKELRLRQQRAKELREKVTWWKSLDGRGFEKEITSLLKKLGYDAHLTPYSADGGIDILIRDGAKKIIVQCKAHSNFISPGVVRELYGTMIHEKADEAWVVTTSGFYSGARAFARGKSIKLITIQELLSKSSSQTKNLT